MKRTWVIGKWIVDFDAGRIRERALFSKPVPPDLRLLRVLQILVERRQRAVSTERIRELAWDGRIVSNDSVSTAIYQLRKLLGDSARSPEYIVTVPHVGYKLIAAARPRWRVRLPAMRPAAFFALTAILIIAAATYEYSRHSAYRRALFIAPMVNSTGDPQLQGLTYAVDATLASALVRSNPELNATRSDRERTGLRLESEVVACDTGAALVVRLIDTRNQQLLWSEYYDFDGDYEEPTLVEHIAGRLSHRLSVY